jgi:hypothetical protein
MAEQYIECPHCGKRIEVSKLLAEQIARDLRKDFDAKSAQLQKEADKRLRETLEKETLRIQQQAKKSAEQKHSAEIVALEARLREKEKQAIYFQKDADKRLREAVEKEKLRIEQQAKKFAEQKHSAKIVALETKLRETEKQAIEFQNQRADLQKQQNELVARQKRLDSEIKKAEQAATDRVEDEFRSRELELEKKLRDARKQAFELKRKLDQSSQQTQGEVAELELENLLRKAFPSDHVEPIAKGKTGADILQTVYSSDGNVCGTIIWESKNSSPWKKAWLPKLRSDQRRAKAQVAVLASIVLPKDVQHFANMEGVWVCEFSVALSLATALRINLIQLALASQSKSARGKMELLFQYVSGTEFKHRVEAIVEAFTSMKEDLSRERQSMEKHWATRQKQLDIFVENVAGLYGDMQAIAGQALPKIRRLELPQSTS